ncbi:hypothetical protein POM88_013119 [Heracleum sosnowskyi]|uniref:Glucose-methanol-choline oxidoreductase C-terminal domain-containing protein n=1 Tax=Heracleum sosnowskyi TaxID=360622 RepID=A0AAD8IZY4_9APIA|nr:hypothetical protein POM88_013119 [Heracleum sosnowskyi]
MSIRGAVSHLEELGCSVTEVSLPSFSLGLPAYYILASSESSSNLSRYDGVRYGNQCESEELNSLYENTRARGFGSEILMYKCSLIPNRIYRRDAIEAYKRNKRNFPREVFNGGFILEKIASPKSTGQLSLSNTNVDDNPNVSFNYFSHPEDVHKCVEGIRLVEKLLASKHLTNYMYSDDETFEKMLNLSVRANFNFIPKHTNDTKSVEQFCKDTVITIWHYHGGCHVGKVVSPDYEVLGVQRLRVIDGSTFSLSPGTNPQGTLLMMGRYMGLKMLRQRLGRAAGF